MTTHPDGTVTEVTGGIRDIKKRHLPDPEGGGDEGPVRTTTFFHDFRTELKAIRHHHDDTGRDSTITPTEFGRELRRALGLGFICNVHGGSGGEAGWGHEAPPGRYVIDINHSLDFSTGRGSGSDDWVIIHPQAYVAFVSAVDDALAHRRSARRTAAVGAISTVQARAGRLVHA